MEVVIKIPDEYYDDNIMVELDEFLTDYFCGTVCKITTLPKDHGRLGDLDMLEKEIVNGIKARTHNRLVNINIFFM